MNKILLLLFIGFSLITKAQIVTTFAGNGTVGRTGDNGPAIEATIGEPDGCTFDSAGNFYFTTVGNEAVRKVTPLGIINTIAGTGGAGYNGDGVAATEAQLNTATGVAIDRFNNIYIADIGNNRIRKIDAVSGIISTIAGSNTIGFGGDGGPATAAILYGPQDICFDKKGNLYIADQGNYRIRKIDTLGIITTIVGNGIGGLSGDSGPATSAELQKMKGICIDRNGKLYIAQDYTIRMVDSSSIITTIAGNGSVGPGGDGGPATAASLNPIRLVCDAIGNLYVSGYINNDARVIDTLGVIHTIAGTGVSGFSGDEGQATAAELSSTYGISLDNCGNLYVADKGNVRIRKVALNPFCWLESVPNSPVTQTISIYPNPANDILHIDNIKTQANYRVLSIVGTVLQQGNLKEGSNSISIQSLPKGMYMLEIVNSERDKTVKKIIKQ